MVLKHLGAYGIWQDEDPNAENYCSSSPFLLAFVLLIWSWVALLVLIIYDVIVSIYLFRHSKDFEEVDQFDAGDDGTRDDML